MIWEQGVRRSRNLGGRFFLAIWGWVLEFRPPPYGGRILPAAGENFLGVLKFTYIIKKNIDLHIFENRQNLDQICIQSNFSESTASLITHITHRKINNESVQCYMLSVWQYHQCITSDQEHKIVYS